MPLDGAGAPPGRGVRNGDLVARADDRRRKAHPVEGWYTANLFAGGVDRIGKKIGEEATEVVIAAKNADRGELVWETADLLYHALVLLAERGVSLDQVGAELSRAAPQIAPETGRSRASAPRPRRNSPRSASRRPADLLALLAARVSRLAQAEADRGPREGEAIVVGRVCA